MGIRGPLLPLAGLLILGYAFPALAWFNPGTGPSEPVLALTETTHGRIIAGGQFTVFDQQPRGGVARLTHDGALENALADANGTVHVAVALPDGGALVGGSFGAIAGYARPGLVRLDAAGTVDPDFDVQLDGAVFAIALQWDGKIVIGGHFSRVRGVARNSIARLNPDGTLDETFNPGWGVAGMVLTVAVQQNGKILAGGLFDWVDGQPFARVARFDSRGLVDPTFRPNPDNIVTGVAEHYGGRIVITGYFTSIAGVARRHVARVNADGTFDPSFAGEANAPVLRLALGTYHVFIGGEFTTVAGLPAAHLARLDPNGRPDPAFPASVDGPVRGLFATGDGKLLVGGQFLTANGQPSPRLVRLRSDGSVEPRVPDFDPGTNELVSRIAREHSGTWLVAGHFTVIGGMSRSGFARLRADGSVDPGFDPQPSHSVNAVVPQPDGRILIGGLYSHIGGVAVSPLTRLHADGTIDTSFSPSFQGEVKAIAVQPDGKIVAGGWFSVGQPWEGRRNIARFHPDGTLDNTFAPTTDGAVYCVAVLPDGKILIGGQFGYVYGNGVRKGLARLHANGWLDWSFDARLDNSPYTVWVSAMAVQPDGRIVIGGRFRKVGDVTRTGLARLQANGGVDTGFSAEAQTTSHVNTIVLETSGKILVAGELYTPREGLVRFESDGRLDSAFDARVLTANWGSVVVAVTRLDDGSLAVGGRFHSIAGTPRTNIARISADGSVVH